MKRSLWSCAKSVNARLTTPALLLLCAACAGGCSTLREKIDTDSLQQAYEELRREWERRQGPNEQEGTAPSVPGSGNTEVAPPVVDTSAPLNGILWRNGAGWRGQNALNFSDEKWSEAVQFWLDSGCNYVSFIVANQRDGANAGYSPYANGLLHGALNEAWLARARQRVAQLKAAGFHINLFLITDDSPGLAAEHARLPGFARQCVEWFEPDTICPSIEMDEVWRSWKGVGESVSAAVEVPVQGHFLKGKVRSFDGMAALLYQATSQDTRRLANEVAGVVKKVDVPVMLFEVSGRGLNGWPEGGTAGIAAGAFGSGVGYKPPTDGDVQQVGILDYKWHAKNHPGNPKKAKQVGYAYGFRLDKNNAKWDRDDRDGSWPNTGDNGTEAIVLLVNHTQKRVDKWEWLYQGATSRTLQNFYDGRHPRYLDYTPNDGDVCSLIILKLDNTEYVISENTDTWKRR